MVPLTSGIQSLIALSCVAGAVVWVTMCGLWWLSGIVGTLWPVSQVEDDE